MGFVHIIIMSLMFVHFSRVSEQHGQQI